MYEPTELERGFFTDKDQEIRTTDMPERFQLRTIPIKALEEGELDDEADWIYKQAFMTNTITSQSLQEQENSAHYGRRGPSMINKIKQAINFMRDQHFEVRKTCSLRQARAQHDQ